MSIYFGDIHTHSNFSDGRQEPPHLMDRARSHLDFFAYSDHAQLPDTVSWGPDVFHGWRYIVQPLGERWFEIQTLIQGNHESGRFVTFLGYEWSSRQWGDHNVYYLKDDEPIRYARSLAELYAALDGVQAMVFPYHTAYPRHNRGFDWRGFDTRKAPMVEICSHHGCAETHVGSKTYNGPGMGPRCQSGAVQRALDLGHVFGIMASSDDHQGWPGSHDMGLMAVHAEELTREALWESFWKRRVYAVTGDRMRLDFRLNDQPMGSIMPIGHDQRRRIRIDVDGWDHLKSVEIIKNGSLAQTWSLLGGAPARDAKRFKVGVEWGYHGGKERAWNIEIEAKGGKIRDYNLHFRMPGHDQVKVIGNQKVEVTSTTAAYRGHQGNDGRIYGGLKQIDLDLEGVKDARLSLRLDGKLVLFNSIDEIMRESRCALPFGPYQGAVQFVQAVPESGFRARAWNGRIPLLKERIETTITPVSRRATIKWAGRLPYGRLGHEANGRIFISRISEYKR